MLIFIVFLTNNNKKGILKLKKIIDSYKLENYKIIINSNIIIEETDFNFKYNLINIQDESVALLFAIHYYDIHEDDFIVKINCNYNLKSHSPFMREIFKLNNNLTDYDVISKYYFSDLIGIKCKYINNINNIGNSDTNINMRWELLKNQIDNKKQLVLNYLGIDISTSNRKSIYTIY